MRVALTGASGFIGSAICRDLKHAGHAVTALVRSTSRRDHIEQSVDRFIVGGQADERAWDALLDDAECVIHNSVDWEVLRDSARRAEHLERNLGASIRLLWRSRPIQFIFISSIAVHHDMRPRWQGQIDEDHPLRPNTVYGAYKAAVEDHLWAEHFEHDRNTCALRPCGVYGIDPKLDRSHGYSLIEKIKRGEPCDKPGGGKFVHVDDVAAATVACVGNEAAAGRVFNLVDCYARWADWAKIACEIMDTSVPIDSSSPPKPKNEFTKEAVQSLGVSMDRGHQGIRSHIAELVNVMNAA